MLTPEVFFDKIAGWFIRKVSISGIFESRKFINCYEGRVKTAIETEFSSIIKAVNQNSAKININSLTQRVINKTIKIYNNSFASDVATALFLSEARKLASKNSSTITTKDIIELLAKVHTFAYIHLKSRSHYSKSKFKRDVTNFKRYFEKSKQELQKLKEELKSLYNEFLEQIKETEEYQRKLEQYMHAVLKYVRENYRWN